jgi:hypothetical protein
LFNYGILKKITSFFVFITILLSLLSLSLTAQSIDSSGDLVFNNSTLIEDNEGVELKDLMMLAPPPSISYLIGYEISSLYGEPVIFCQAAIVIDPKLGTNNIEKYKRLTVIDINFFGVFERERYVISCDVGAPKRPFIGSIDEFRSLSDERKSDHLSFNVAGSPSWDELIHISPNFTQYSSPGGVAMGWNKLDPGNKYLNPSKAKELLLNDDFSFMEWSYSYSTGSFVEVAWDFSQLERYVAEIEKRKVQKTITKVENDVSQLEKKAREEAKEEYGEDFWDQPDNPVKEADSTVMNKLINQLRKNHNLDKSLAEKIAEANKEFQYKNKIYSRKLNKLKNTPTPEELFELIVFDKSIDWTNIYGYKIKNGPTVIEPMYESASSFNKNGFARVETGRVSSKLLDKYKPGWEDQPLNISCKTIRYNCGVIIDKKNNLHIVFDNSDHVQAISKNTFFVRADKYKGAVEGQVIDKSGKILFKRDCLWYNLDGTDLIVYSDKCAEESDISIDWYQGTYSYIRPANWDYPFYKVGLMDINGNVVLEPKNYNFFLEADLKKNRFYVTEYTGNTEESYRNFWIDNEGNRISDYETREQIQMPQLKMTREKY